MPQINPIDIVAPGALGLNSEAASTLLSPQWATIALNAVINRSGRLASRRGWTNQTVNAIAATPTIFKMFEFINKSGTAVVISCAGNKIFRDISDFTDVTNDITPATLPTANYWQFINFNGKVLGFQRDHAPIERTSGDFTNAIYTGTGPDGNCAVAAFGRVWAADADLQTIRYSALLDDTDYSTASGGGTIDMSSVWTGGMDQIVALAVIGANLVCFGKNHIVLWADGSGSEIGLDPLAIEVSDTIEGTGCIARDSVQRTGEGDLIFLSRHGLQSLGRVIESKSNPIVTLTRNVRTEFGEAVAQSRAVDAQLDKVTAVVSPENGLYVINLPSVNKMYVLDIYHPFQDTDGNVVFPVTTWQMGGGIHGMLATVSGNMYFGSAGVVGKYADLSDNSVGYDFQFETGWLDFGELNHRLKILKELISSVSIGTGNIRWTWEFDFNGTTLSRTMSYTGGTTSEFNIAEFNIASFAGAVLIQRKIIPAHGEGQFLKLGATSHVNGFDVVLQHMSISPKIGRMVT